MDKGEISRKRGVRVSSILDEDGFAVYTLRFYDITSIFFRLIFIFQYRVYCLGVVRWVWPCFLFKKNNFFLSFQSAWWEREKKKKRVKYFFLKISSFLKIGVHDTFPLQRSIQRSRPIIITILFPESCIYAIPLHVSGTRPKGGKGRGKSLVSRGKIETREHLRLIAPLPNNQSSIFPARFPALYLDFSVPRKKCIVFFFIFPFFLAPDKRGSSFAF